MTELFARLSDLTMRPRPFSRYTTIEMWNDDHISRQMLEVHLDPANDLASRNSVFIGRSLDWIKDRFAVSAATRVVDFGCGPGLYTTELAAAGAEVTGIDVSKRSIDYASKTARRRGLSMHYLTGNYLEVGLPGSYDLITMIFCDFGVLSPEQRKRLLGTWRSILKRGGRILFDVPSLAYFDSAAEGCSYEYERVGGFWSAGPYFVFHDTFRWEARKLLLERHTVVEADRTRAFYDWLQCFSRESLTRELGRAGLSVEAMYANVAGDPPSDEAMEIAVVAAHGG